MAEETKVEETTEQKSPAVEENREVEEIETQQEAPEDKNWKAVREELNALKEENRALREMGMVAETPQSKTRSVLDSLYLTNEENDALSKEEIKAEIKYPELEEQGLYSMAVYGEYRSALDKYNLQKSLGVQTKLPSLLDIAKRVKSDYDTKFSSVTKKAEEEGAKKAQQSVASREATVETETRSDRGIAASALEELEGLKLKSREGDMNAVAERLKRSGL